MKKTGENATLGCSAKGIPLNVEWKIKKENKEMVASCVGKFDVWTDLLLDQEKYSSYYKDH